MTISPSTRQQLERLLQRYLLPSIALVYLISAFLPEPGLWLRRQVLWDGWPTGIGEVTPVNLLLAGLLFNTGLAVPFGELLCIIRHPKVVALGLAIRIASAILILLLAILGGTVFSGELWNSIVLGLLLVAVMPVANSSAGWAHHSEANVGLSMWLIVISVLISPVLVPGLLEIASHSLDETAVTYCHELSAGYAGSFVMIWVIIPAVLGVITRHVVIKEYTPQIKLTVKVLTSLFLLILNYANGSASLPSLVSGGQTGLILFIGMTSGLLCSLLFAAAWIMACLCRLPQRDRLSVMYSTAMSNTGIALVLSTTVLPTLVVLHLIIIFYTLLQHIIAGIIDEWAVMTMAKKNHSLTTPCTMTSQPVLNDSEERPTTQTGSHAARYGGEACSAKGSW